MGNGQHIAVNSRIRALLTQELPQHRRKWSIGRYITNGAIHHIGISENDVAMQVIELRLSGVFVSDERRETTSRATIIVAFRSILNLLPHGNSGAIAIHPILITKF